ncbi:MAG: divergent polysaccharide deacetylase family protein [Nautiliaceae bacterium]
MKKILLIVFFVLLSVIIFLEGAKIKSLYAKIENLKDEITKLKTKIIELKKENNLLKTTKSEIEDYYRNLHPIQKIQKPIKKSKKPKLVIIIDDVAFNYEAKMIKQIPLHITPSFFPPDKRHPNTFKYAKEFTHYMVHLPLEAINYPTPENNTLLTSMSKEEILKKITHLKKLFPKLKFVNNHTGSKFTNSLVAMKKLFFALKINHLGFVDSLTISTTKSKLANKIYHIPLYMRDLFLDNNSNPAYIKKQLKKAVKIAKKYGYCIAIGHPHKTTLTTIKNSLDLLKDVKVVYIDELNSN